MTEPVTNLGPAGMVGVLCGAHAQLLRAGPGIYPVLLVGGGWHQRRSGRKLAITGEPLRELTVPHRWQLDDEVDLVGAVMEATPALTVGTVPVGPHA